MCVVCLITFIFCHNRTYAICVAEGIDRAYHFIPHTHRHHLFIYPSLNDLDEVISI